MNKKALSLLEIIISAVILAIIMGGLANIFMSGKRYMMHNRYRMTGGELGKHFMDPLQMDVRQDQWGNNCLSGNTADCTARFGNWLDPSDKTDYRATYVTSNVDPSMKLRKAVVTIKWNERS